MSYNVEKSKLLGMFPGEVYEILKEEKCFLAGGAITSLFTMKEINDFDIYVRDFKSLVRIILFLKSNYEMVYTNHTSKSILFVKDDCKVQIIHFQFFQNMWQIFRTFDFTCCMGGWDFEKEEFVFHPDFFKSNSQRRLSFIPLTAYPLVSAMRVQKYLDRGYTISKAEFMKIMLTVANLKIDSWEKVKEHVGGMYGHDEDSLFDIEEDYSFEKSVSVLSKINKTSFSIKSIDELFKEIIQQHNKDYKPRFFKWVTKDLKSICSSWKLDYQAGSVVNGGGYGIYCCNEFHIDNHYYNKPEHVMIELEPIEIPDYFVWYDEELRLLGDVKVLGVVKSGWKEGPAF